MFINDFMPKVRKRKKYLRINFHLLLITIILLLTVINIEVYYHKQKATVTANEVLGVSAKSEDELNRWMEITRQNPWYLPAWVEIVKIAKDKNDELLKNTALENIKKIDPNNILLQN